MHEAVQRAERRLAEPDAYPSDVIALVVLWLLRYKLSLCDLAEMFQIRGFVFSYEAVPDPEAKLTPVLAKELRRRRKEKASRSWYIDEMYIQIRGCWTSYTEQWIVTAFWSR
jgi:transposase-like protein